MSRVFVGSSFRRRIRLARRSDWPIRVWTANGVVASKGSEVSAIASGRNVPGTWDLVTDRRTLAHSKQKEEKGGTKRSQSHWCEHPGRPEEA